MIITNKAGLPQAFVEMAKTEYNVQPNEYRVTSLLKGVRETLLMRRHDAEIERDCSDMVWLLFGTAVHYILSLQPESSDELKETRISCDFGKYKLSGQFDLYNIKSETVTDYKTCSVWKVTLNDYSDWRRQTLIYAYMLNKIGFPARHGEIVAIMKDHQKSKAKYDPTYPKLPVTIIRFDFDDDDFAEIEKWLWDKFAEIERCENLPDDELPLCTMDERYNKGDQFAVMKVGRKTAMRVLGSLAEAQSYIGGAEGFTIEIRRGEDKKCGEYCACNTFCEHWRNKNGQS